MIAYKIVVNQSKLYPQSIKTHSGHREFKSDLDNSGVRNEIYIYSSTGHTFANPSGVSYAPKETGGAWNKTLSFLDR
ncbi:MAG: dienelactone hydrolase family protein [Nitrosotalea sp.]